MATIHPTAIVDPKAELAADVEVGPYAIIGPDVKVGAGTVVQAHAYLSGHTTVGQQCEIFPFACVGMKTQDLKYQAGDVTFAAPITDTANCQIMLHKSGTGTLRLNAVNTATGTINHGGGSLFVNGSTPAPVSVTAGATLGGSGTTGSVTLTGETAASPALVSPGNASAATLTSTGTFTFGPDSRYVWELAEAVENQPPVHDRIDAAILGFTATAERPMVIHTGSAWCRGRG